MSLADYIKGTNKCLVLAMDCPGENTPNLPKESLFRQLNQHNLPFTVAMVSDTLSLIEIVENASKGKFLNHLSLNRYVTLSLPFLACDTHSCHGTEAWPCQIIT